MEVVLDLRATRAAATAADRAVLLALASAAVRAARQVRAFVRRSRVELAPCEGTITVLRATLVARVVLVAVRLEVLSESVARARTVEVTTTRKVTAIDRDEIARRVVTTLLVRRMTVEVSARIRTGAAATRGGGDVMLARAGVLAAVLATVRPPTRRERAVNTAA